MVLLIVASIIPFLALVILFLMKKTKGAKFVQWEEVGKPVEEPEGTGRIAQLSNEEVLYNIPITWNDFTVILSEVRIRKNGIFLIVRKNRSGHIIGCSDDIYWQQTKHKQNKNMKNPVREARLHVFVLSKALRNIGIFDWVQGVVVFDNLHVSLNIDSPAFPVLKEEELRDYLINFRPYKIITDKNILTIIEWLNTAREIVLTSEYEN
ncbi:nuclease-related domain-containing protein [Cohnella soli]|uniref:Nuclease-related domain-containing protein n=1 Tax=Cohnella soli TaxID=425005 RepID=A0ABW0HPT6_9BACL